MRRSTPALLLIAALSAGPLGPVATAAAQQPQPQPQQVQPTEQGAQDYKTLAREGAKAFAAKDYEAAAEAFQKAYEQKPVPNLLYNAGRALEKSGDFEGAISYYEKFVNEPDVELKARRDALQRLKTLREVLALREEGEEVERDEVEAKQGDRELADTGAEAAREGQQDKQVEPAPTVVDENYTPAWIFTSAGAAALIGSGVFAVLAAGEKSNFDDAATLAERRNAADSGQTYTTVADSMLAAGAVLAGVGLYFWVSPPESERASSQTPSARIAPGVGADGASLTFTLDF